MRMPAPPEGAHPVARRGLAPASRPEEPERRRPTRRREDGLAERIDVASAPLHRCLRSDREQRPAMRRRARRRKGLASRMERQERNLALEIVRGAFAAIFLPFTWAAGVPAAFVTLVRRAARPGGEPGQSARLERPNTGK